MTKTKTSFDPAAVRMLAGLVTEIEADFARADTPIAVRDRRDIAAQVMAAAISGETDPERIKEKVRHRDCR